MNWEASTIPPKRLVSGSSLQGGYAVVYRDYLRGCDRGLYLGAEGEARDRKLNFWSQERPIFPWEYRNNKHLGEGYEMSST